MAKLHLKIASPERVLLDEEADKIIAPTKNGQITVLPGHAFLMTELVHGDMIVRNDKNEKVILVYGGFLHVKNDNQVIVLADSAEHLHEVTEKGAEDARKRAEDLAEEVRDDRERFAEVEAELARSLSRIKIFRKHRTRKHMNMDE